MHLIKAKDCLRILERAKRKHLRKPSALKKLAAISEEKLLEASSVVKTLAEVCGYFDTGTEYKLRVLFSFGFLHQQRNPCSKVACMCMRVCVHL